MDLVIHLIKYKEVTRPSQNNYHGQTVFWARPTHNKA